MNTDSLSAGKHLRPQIFCKVSNLSSKNVRYGVYYLWLIHKNVRRHLVAADVSVSVESCSCIKIQIQSLNLYQKLYPIFILKQLVEPA